jgi:hypothetical protein
VSLLDKVIDTLHSFFYSQKRSVSVGSRLIAVTAVILTVTTVFPTLAEEMLPPSQVEESSAPQSEPSEDNSEQPAEEQPDQQELESDASAALSDEEQAKREEERRAEEERKAEEVKVKVATVQPQIKFRFPQSIALDPRASVENLPQLAITGGSIGLLCLSSNAIIDLYAKGSLNNIVIATPTAKTDDKDSQTESADAAQLNRSALQVAGDLTSFVRISGPLYQINELINSAGGLRITASQRRVVNSNITARYVELTGSDLSPVFCTKAINQRSIGFRALGLQMDTVKTRVDFNKPSGK